MVMLLGQVEVVQVDWQNVALMQNDVSYVGYGAQLTWPAAELCVVPVVVGRPFAQSQLSVAAGHLTESE